MSQITLALNGEAIPLKNLTVTPSMQFQDKDQSGQSSSTANAEQGIKPKELRIMGVIPFIEVKTLKRLFALAEAKEGQKLMRYRVANQVAEAINFRLATFTNSIEASTLDGKQAWQVTFTLREHISIAEKRDARTASKTAATKQTGKPGQTTTEEEEKEELSWFERKVLKPTNDALGSMMGGDNEANK